jgi:hypothetical protein
MFELELKRNNALEHVEEILDDSPPALREKVEWLAGTLAEDWRRSVVCRYQIAVTIRDIYDDVNENNGAVYGAKAVKVIKGRFGWDDGVIYRALIVANAFTLAEIEEITRLRLPHGNALSYSHVVELARVEDEKQREKLLTQAVKEGWTTRKLANAVAPFREAPNAPVPLAGPREDRRGRPLAKPRNFDAVLEQQASFAWDFLNRNDHVWSDPEHGLWGKALILSTTDYTPERVERVKAHAEQMKLLAQKAAERAEEADAIHKRFVEAHKGREGKQRKVGRPVPPESTAVDPP